MNRTLLSGSPPVSPHSPQRDLARRHLYAWYTYAFAAEVFSACAMAIFLPITLEQMAREVGYVAPDLEIPCTQALEDGTKGAVCKALILGRWVDTASFSSTYFHAVRRCQWEIDRSMYVKSLAVALQAMFIISLGPLADSAFWRKRLLILFAYTGSISGIALLCFPRRPSLALPPLAALLTIIANIGYAVSIVCANAFLPALAKEDPLVFGAATSILPAPAVDDQGEGEQQGLLADQPLLEAISTADLAHTISRSSLDENDGNQARYAAILSLTTSRISSIGTGIGFFSGVAVLTLLTIPVTIGQGSTASLRLAIGLSGIWWAVFTIPVWLGLPGRSTTDRKEQDMKVTKFRPLDGWKRVGRMVTPREMRRLPNLFTLLFAWIFLSDGVLAIDPLTSGFHTTTYTAILYASVTLQMPPSRIILIGILVQLSAVCSSLFTPRVQRSYSWTNLAVLLRIVLLALVLPIYTCAGLILPFGGLRTEAEMYVAATWFGLLYGPFNSYSRAVYAELIPSGHESSFFSLFALTDKSASFLGPFIVGVIADTTGNIRLGFLFLLVMLLAPVPVLLRLDVERGKREANVWTVDR